MDELRIESFFPVDDPGDRLLRELCAALGAVSGTLPAFEYPIQAIKVTDGQGSRIQQTMKR